jgi:hypothetical protein
MALAGASVVAMVNAGTASALGAAVYSYSGTNETGTVTTTSTFDANGCAQIPAAFSGQNGLSQDVTFYHWNVDSWNYDGSLAHSQAANLSSSATLVCLGDNAKPPGES